MSVCVFVSCMVVKCPRCGGRVLWSMGEWECVECGYRFRVEKRETVRGEEVTPTPTIMEIRREEVPAVERKSFKWLVISIVLLVAGLLSGYLLGMVFMQSGGPSTKTVFVPATIQITTTYTEKYIETFTKTQTVTIVTTLEKQTPTREEYLLKVLEVVVDTVSEKDYDYYIMMLEAKYIGGKSWGFNFLYISLLSDVGYKYNAFLPVLLRQPLGAVDLKSGESVRGQVAFKLPKNEKPYKLIYDDKINWIILETTDIPEPRGEVSYIYFVEVDVRSEYSVIWSSGSMKTPGIAFYSGEIIEVELDVKYDRFIGNPPNITITSINVEGFEIVEIDPKIPLIVNDGEEVKIKLALKVPEKGYKGNLKITLSA
ncbi:MAG: DUF4352 domain-containing protein [Nitrososphaerota archaeon]